MAAETPRPTSAMMDPSTQSAGSRMWEKTKAAPYVPLGIAGMFGTVAYGAYSFRHRGQMSPSVFLMHLRVKAQSMVVGAMTLGVTYSMLSQYVFNKKPSDSVDEKK